MDPEPERRAPASAPSAVATAKQTLRRRLAVRARRLAPFGRSEGWSSVVQAIAVGVAGGIGAIAFRYLIAGVRWLFFEGAGQLARPLVGDAYVIALPAVGIVLVSYMVRRWAPEARGHGVPEVQYAVRKRRGIIRPRVALVKALASALCIGSGGSVGREGPIVQIGCTLGSTLGQLLGLSAQRVRLLVACGAAAAVGGTFNAPIGGVMFAMEVILGSFAARSFGLVVIASVTSTAICRGVLGNEPAFELSQVFQLHSYAELPIYAALGLAAGFVALAYVRALYAFESIVDRWTAPPTVKALLGGAAVGLVGWTCLRHFGGPYLFGVGYDGIEKALRIQGGELAWSLGTTFTVSVLLILVVLKIFATSMTLASGGSGGVFAPGLFIGAMTGGAFGLLVNAWFPAITAPPGAYALVGMAAIFAGSAHAPITAILILFEMTDNYQIMLPLMIAVVIAHLVASGLNPDSIYSLKLRRLGGLTPNRSAPSVLDLVLVADATSSDYLTVKVGTPLLQLARRLHETSNRCALVLDGNGKMAGIVTDRDVEPALLDDRGAGIVDEVMTRTILTCTPDQKLRDVADTLRDQDLGQIPVVDRDDSSKLVGILRRRELMWAYGELASEREELLAQDDPDAAIPESRREQDTVLLDVELGARHDKLCFKKIRDLSLPDEVRVVFVRRAGHTMVAGGSTVIEPGDVLVLLSARAHEAHMRQWVEQMTAAGQAPL